MMQRDALRDNPLSLDHLIAEVVAYPFGSVRSLTDGFTWFTAPSDMWDCAEFDLLQRFPGVSVEELRMHRDAEWFPEGTSNTSLCTLVRSIAKRYLQPEGLIAKPSDVEQSNAYSRLTAHQARARWRWLARSIPADLLLAALWDSDNEPISVTLAQPQVAQRLLDGGFAEVHLHIGGGLDFQNYWAGTMAGLMHRATKSDSFAAQGAPLNGGKDLGAWLVAAATIRLLLGEFLAYRRQNSNSVPFVPFIRDSLFPTYRLLHGVTLVDSFRKSIEAVRIGSLKSIQYSFASRKTAYRSICQNSKRKPGMQLFDMDPLSRSFPNASQRSCPPEMLFVHEGLDYLSKSVDADFEQLFWQVQKIRCIYFRSIVMHPRTPGLNAFIRTFSRLFAGKRALNEASLAVQSAQVSGLDRGLRYLEIRTAPHDRFTGISGVIKELDCELDDLPNRQNPKKKQPWEWGIILHFIRSRGKDADARQQEPFEPNSFANPGYAYNTSGFRYSGYLSQIQRQADAIHKLLQVHPTMLRWLRGIDLCTDETAIPTWVFQSMFRSLKQASQRASLNLKKMHGVDVKPLRCTVHVGEDFPHLLTGLRNIAHVLDYFPVTEGDRLGHALALGLDSDRWSQTKGRVRMTKEDRLLDAVWAWDAVTRGGFAINDFQGVASTLEREINVLSRSMFRTECATEDMVTLMRNLHNPAAVAKTGFPYQRTAATTTKAEELLTEYLISSVAYKAGRELFWVDTSQDTSLCAEMQRNLRRRVSEKGMAIEINPSSNLLIGNLGDLRYHPFWNLANLGSKSEFASVPLVVGSDDPITFGTTLPDEYSLLHDALVESGKSSDDSLRWIEELRRAGNDFRFTCD